MAWHWRLSKGEDYAPPKSLPGGHPGNPGEGEGETATMTRCADGRDPCPTFPLPPASDWRSTDEQEVLRRVQRDIDETPSVRAVDDRHPVFTTFAVKSPSGMKYQVEVRDVASRAVSCTCPDFRTAGLGTCKHVEATLIHL